MRLLRPHPPRAPSATVADRGRRGHLWSRGHGHRRRCLRHAVSPPRCWAAVAAGASCGAAGVAGKNNSCAVEMAERNPLLRARAQGSGTAGLKL